MLKPLHLVLVIAALALTVAGAPTVRGQAGDQSRPATSSTIGDTAGWTNKVEIADIDNDDRLDLLFANGGNYLAIGLKSLWLAATPTHIWRLDPKRVEAIRK